MKTSPLNDELLGRYLDGVATEEDLVALQQDIVARPEMADALVALVRFEMLIHTQFKHANRAHEFETLLTKLSPSHSSDRCGSRDEPAEVADLQGVPTAESTIPGSIPRLTFQNTLSGLSSGWPMAYLIATVVFAIGFLIGAHTYVSQPGQVANEFPTRSVPAVNPGESVGRITGMVECKWDAAETAPAPNSRVSLGSKFNLVSGLMEITYDTGAKVILEGPVVYEVESATGGYLAAGRVTARLEKSSNREARGIRNVAGAVASHPKSVTMSPTFAVRTSNALVTDLGTEFGVEVPRRGDTVVHVFEGKVDCQPIMADGERVAAKQLTAGQTARIASGTVTVASESHSKEPFVRKIRDGRSPATEVASSQVIAYWRFEERVPPGNPDSKQPHAKRGMVGDVLQEKVIRDWSGHGNDLNYNPCNVRWELGIGDYVASQDVPPSSMFRPGHSGGTKSFNSGALAPNKDGVLFHSALQHGNAFDFQDSFTMEGYFKTDGDQSGVGVMALVFKGPDGPVYLVSLNRQTPGAAQFTLFDAAGRTVSVTAADRNFADGQWRYFAARFDAAGRSATLLLIAADGQVHRHATRVPANFVLNWPNNDLLIGRLQHRPGNVQGHFRGRIDEVRICRGLLGDEQLLCPQQAQTDEGSNTK